jgi:hypothetical protein
MAAVSRERIADCPIHNHRYDRQYLLYIHDMLFAIEWRSPTYNRYCSTLSYSPAPDEVPKATNSYSDKQTCAAFAERIESVQFFYAACLEALYFGMHWSVDSPQPLPMQGPMKRLLL